MEIIEDKWMTFRSYMEVCSIHIFHALKWEMEALKMNKKQGQIV